MSTPLPFLLDGRIHPAKYMFSGGGVGRNICEALHKLGKSPLFISAVGADDSGNLLKSMIPAECRDNVMTLRQHSTAQCTIVLDSKGDCPFLMGDMDIHSQITSEMIFQQEEAIKTAPLLILDGNLSLASMETALLLATKHNIPVFYEPTDLEISSKPFETKHGNAVKFITPNLNELKHVANFLNIPIDTKKSFASKIEEAAYLAKQLVKFSSGTTTTVIVTLGPLGVVIARNNSANEPLLLCSLNGSSSDTKARHYPTKEITNFTNVNGAGDCFASGVIAAMLDGCTEERCVSVGFAAAQTALFSSSAVPDVIFNKGHQSWKNEAKYVTL